MRSEHTNYVVRPYTSNDNAGLAVMWNESDDQWPGTLTRGVPFTEERMRKWMEQETCLMRLVVEDTSDNAVVGFGSLWEKPGRKDTCYVATLNVHPAHQKRSLARRMLTQMIDWATEHGYCRVTINTWPANIKSVPLYKKVGFSWVPDMNVFMENYIPAIRQLPLARNFFTRHDWYTTFQRDLSQKEDEERHPATGDMKVFIFRWEEDGELLEVVIDRYAQSITGIETVDFAAYAVIDESEPAQGFSYPVRWHVTNKQDKSMNISILAEGEKGISLNYQTSFVLDGGDSRDIEANFVCAADAERLKLAKRDRSKTAPKIKTTLVFGSHSPTGSQQQMIELGTGLHYRPAMDISLDPQFPSLLPGEEQMIHIILRNRAGQPIKGMVSIVPQKGLKTDWMRHEVEIEPEHHAGLPLKVVSDRAGAMPLTVNATITSEDRPITIEPKRLPLLVTPLGGVSADLNTDDEYVVVENDFFQIVCHARGGFCRIHNKSLKRGNTIILEEVGAPFQPADLREKEYDLALENGQGWARITMTAKSGRFPGLRVVREISVTASPVVQVGYRLVNSGTIAHEVQVCSNVFFSNFDREIGTVALPRAERFIVTRAIEFPSAHGDLPEDPEKMAEQWMAISREGQAVGIIWGQNVVKHETWWQSPALFSAKRTIEPQSMTAVDPLHVYIGPGDWRDVRRIWQRITGKSIQYIESLPEPESPHTFNLRPSPLVAFGSEVGAQLYVESVRLQKLEGRIVIEPPKGWTADRTDIAIEGVNSDEPLSVSLRLMTEDERIGAFSGELRFENQLRDEVRPFTILRLGDDQSPVTIEKQQKAEQPVWFINNGRCEWTIAPDFHAGIIAWHEVGKEDEERSPNHLMTSFPENGNLGWLRPWFGGIRSTVIIDSDVRDWPGRLQDEVFTVQPFEETIKDGLTWRGVQLASALKREGFKGLRLELHYLTLGGSNVLKLISRVVNESSAPRRVSPGFLVFAQVDGKHEKSVLYADNLQRKRMAEMAWTRVGSWGAVVNPESHRAMVMVSGCGKTLMGVMDWGKDGGHFWYDDELTVPPFESCEIVGYLALTESLEQARHYETLKHWDTEQKNLTKEFFSRTT